MEPDGERTNAPTQLPEKLLKQYSEVEQEFFEILRSDPKKAFKIWDNLFQEILKEQPEGIRYHKGGELHNMGIAKLFEMSPIDSMDYFMLAFIEDTLSTETESGEAPLAAPAAQNLRNLFGFQDQDFSLLQKLVSESTSEQKVVKDPKYVLDKLNSFTVRKDLEKRASKVQFGLSPNKESISRIPGEWEKRVFIGGDYERLYLLCWIKIAVMENGYTPIIALEFNTPEELIHDHALLLLHNSKHAIFDVSTKGGHLMEIERIFEYKTNALFICEDKHFSSISGMLRSLGKNTERFKSYEDVKKIVDEFLEKDRQKVQNAKIHQYLIDHPLTTSSEINPDDFK